MIKAVFLDVDGTLLDFDGYVKESLRNGFEKFHLGPYSPQIYEVFESVNTPLWQQIERGEITREELMKVRFQRVFDRLGIDFHGPTFETYFRDCLFESAILLEGARELVSYLAQKGYILCIASNGPYGQQENRLKKAGLLPMLEHLFVSEKIGAAKPAKAFFDACFASLPGILPEETILIGDSLTADMAGGMGYGMKTCWYNPMKKEKPEGMEIDYIVGDLREIKEILTPSTHSPAGFDSIT